MEKILRGCENFDGKFIGYENVWEKIKGYEIFNSVPFKGYEISWR